MATEPMQKAILDACFGDHDAAAVKGVPRAVLLRAGVSVEDIESLGKPRFWLYRRLVRGNVIGVMHDLLERSCKRAAAHAPGEIDAAFDAFLAEVGPRTHHLRDVPAEFVDWLAPQWENGKRFYTSNAVLPKYMADFARFESERFSTGTRLANVPETLHDIHAARPLALHGSLALLTTHFAVHELEEAKDDSPASDTPREAHTHYAIYRDADHTVRVLLCTPFVFAFATRAVDGRPLSACIQEAATETSLAAGDVTGELAKLLADWAERGLLLGAL